MSNKNVEKLVTLYVAYGKLDDTVEVNSVECKETAKMFVVKNKFHEGPPYATNIRKEFVEGAQPDDSWHMLTYGFSKEQAIDNFKKIIARKRAKYENTFRRNMEALSKLEESLQELPRQSKTRGGDLTVS